MPRHLHPQAGGDPRQQGPVRELANQPPSPGIDNEFPDVPDENRPSDSPAGETGDDEADDDGADDDADDDADGDGDVDD